MAQTIKNLPAMQETLVPSLGQSHGQRNPASYSPWGHKESDMTERLTLHFTFHLFYRAFLGRTSRLFIGLSLKTGTNRD